MKTTRILVLASRQSGELVLGLKQIIEDVAAGGYSLIGVLFVENEVEKSLRECAGVWRGREPDLLLACFEGQSLGNVSTWLNGAREVCKGAPVLAVVDGSRPTDIGKLFECGVSDF